MTYQEIEVFPYCSTDDVLDYLKGISITDVSPTSELESLIKISSEDINRATRRNFNKTTLTERYSGTGQQTLVMNQYPITDVAEIKIYTQAHQLVTDLKKTDSDFTSKVLIDHKNGQITLVSAIPTNFPYVMNTWPQSVYGITTYRATDYDYSSRFGVGEQNVEITYTYGFDQPPEGIKDACKKLVVIELLKKRGAVDTQGLTSETIAGASFNYATRGASGGGGPYAHLIDELQADVDSVLAKYVRHTWAVI